MSETAGMLLIFAVIVLVILIKEIVANKFPASHRANRLLNPPRGRHSNDGGGSYDSSCDGGD